MRPAPNELIEPFRKTGRHPQLGLYPPESAGNNGVFLIPHKKKLAKKPQIFQCIISDITGWDHVSVIIQDAKRTPSWIEMCFIKSTFFANGELAMQLHPRMEDYINMHPYCLHLWRPNDAEMLLPPKELVGWK